MIATTTHQQHEGSVFSRARRAVSSTWCTTAAFAYTTHRSNGVAANAAGYMSAKRSARHLELRST